jgi:phosphoglucomutase
MHAVTGAYAGPIFVEKLGADPVDYHFYYNITYFQKLEELHSLMLNTSFQDCILNGMPLEDFGNGHPDPNLTYAYHFLKKIDIHHFICNSSTHFSLLNLISYCCTY